MNVPTELLVVVAFGGELGRPRAPVSFAGGTFGAEFAGAFAADRGQARPGEADDEEEADEAVSNGGG